MSFALSAGVTGLQAQQKMPDAAGKNQVNANTTALKSSGTTFSAQLREKTQKASQSTSPVESYCYKLRHCSREQIQTNQGAVEPLRFCQRSMAELAVNLGGGS
jgi:flagellar hook protein FlgE